MDLFCCAGGAGMGYALAGFDVVGVDITPQPRYPFTFIQADAIEYLRDHGGEFDAIHASPPCQMFCAYRRVRPHKGDEHYINLIPDTRAALIASGKPYVIENVANAPLLDPAILCGSMFDPIMIVRRHRLFEANWTIATPGPCRHNHPDLIPRFPASTDRGKLSRRTVEVGSWDIRPEVQQAAMGIDWMTVPELSQAIPPRYTEWIGRQLIGIV